MAFATIDVTKGITGSIPTANLPTIPVTKGGTNLTSGTTDQFLKFTGTIFQLQNYLWGLII